MTTSFKTLDDVDVSGKRVLLRVDLNVPMEDGRVTDATRIERVAADHPRDRRQGRQGDPALAFRPAQGRANAKDFAAAGRRGGRRAARAARWPSPSDCIGAPAAQAVAAMKDGDVLLPRKHPLPQGRGEERPGLRRRTRRARRYFCQRRLLGGASRPRLDRGARAQAAGLRRPRHAGRARGAEQGAGHPRSARCWRSSAAPRFRPSSICSAIWSPRSMTLVIGGGMANTFLAAQGKAVGKSLCEHDLLDTAREIMAKAEAAGCRDRAAGRCRRSPRNSRPHAPSRVVSVDRCRRRRHDPRRRPARPSPHVESLLAKAKTLVWNGPVRRLRDCRPSTTAPSQSRERPRGLTREPASCSRSPAAATRWRR